MGQVVDQRLMLLKFHLFFFNKNPEVVRTRLDPGNGSISTPSSSSRITVYLGTKPMPSPEMAPLMMPLTWLIRITFLILLRFFFRYGRQKIFPNQSSSLSLDRIDNPLQVIHFFDPVLFHKFR